MNDNGILNEAASCPSRRFVPIVFFMGCTVQGSFDKEYRPLLDLRADDAIGSW